MPRGKPLTQLEMQTLELIAQGRTNKEIGTMLFRSTKCIEHRRDRLMAKLGIRGTAGLTLYFRSLTSKNGSNGSGGTG